MAKCLVTGGAGFIGSNLVDSLIKEAYEVVVVDNLYSGRKEYLNPKAKFYNLDIRSEKIKEVFQAEKFEFVFHLAAQIDARYSVRDPLFDLDVNVKGGLNILENCRESGVKKIIFASTGGALYGDDVSQIPTPESIQPGPVTPYGIHKLTLEKYLNYYRQVFGQDYIALRFANVYGPRQYKGGESGVISIFIDKAVSGETCTINGTGEQTRDYVYVEDIVKGFLKAKDSDFSGELNLGSGQETSVLELVEKIENAWGEKLKVSHAPEPPGDQKRSCLDAGRAGEILNWKPQVSLEEGIKKTLAWTREKRQ